MQASADKLQRNVDCVSDEHHLAELAAIASAASQVSASLQAACAARASPSASTCRRWRR